MTCTCDPTIIAPIALQVQNVLNDVNSIIKLTQDMNRLNGDIATSVVDNLSLLLPTIPTPPVLNISTIVSLITCPLTPIALGVDYQTLSAMDPRAIAIKYKRILKAQTAQVIEQYEVNLAQLKSAQIIQQMRRFVTECYRTMGDVADFTQQYPMALQNSLFVKAGCPELYSDTTYPFSALVNIANTWSFDGFLPSGIVAPAVPNLKILAQCELKLNAWRVLATLPV